MVDHRIVSLAQGKDIPLRALVRFNQFGVTLAGQVVGISHDDPMRYDLRLDNGAIVANVPELEIDAVIDASAPDPERVPARRGLVARLRRTGT
jgi:hypothetical protein